MPLDLPRRHKTGDHRGGHGSTPSTHARMNGCRITESSSGAEINAPVVAALFASSNLTEEALRERILDPYEQGTAITWRGYTIPAAEIHQLRIYLTAETIDESGSGAWSLATHGTEVTNEQITGPPGGQVVTMPSARSSREGSSLRDRRRVMVVHGRNLAARDAVFTFLRRWGCSRSSGKRRSGRLVWAHRTTSTPFRLRWTSDRLSSSLQPGIVLASCENSRQALRTPLIFD